MTQYKEQELEKVNGGNNQYISQYPNKLDKYATEHYIGHVLYFDYFESSGSVGVNYCWILGTLLNSYEKSTGCGTTVRTATVSIIDSYSKTGGIIDLSLDAWTAHSK